MTLNLFLLLATWACCAIGFALPLSSFLNEKRAKKREGKEVHDKWWSAEKRSVTTRGVLTIVIWTIFGVFALTSALYWLDTAAGGYTAMLNYLTFSGPSLAALVVGAGILKLKPHAEQPLTEIDFRYYFLGLPLLILGYLGFIGKNESTIVNFGAAAMGILSFGVPLVVRVFGGYPEVVPLDRRTYWGLVSVLAGVGALYVLKIRSG